MADLPTCDYCGTDDPVHHKLGWLTVVYQNDHLLGRFCGGGCAAAWLLRAHHRLFGAVPRD